MQSHRILSGLTIFVMVLLVAAGWFLVAQPQLASASTANDQLTSVNTQIQATEASIANLRSETKKLPSLKKDLAALRASIPGEAKVSDYITSLNELAAGAGVSITGIKVSDAQAYTPPIIAPAADGSTTTGGSSSSSTPSPSATATAAPAPTPTAPVAWTPTTDPTITAANFVAIPVEVTTQGDWPTTLAFIKSLQKSTRLFLVSGIETTHAADNPNVLTAVTTGYIYVILDAKGAKIDTSGSTGTATPTATPTPTVTPNPSGSSTPTPTTSPTPTK